LSLAALRYYVAIVDQLSGSEAKVMTILADVHNAQTGQCNPSAPTIAVRTGMSERHVRRVVAALESAGVIAVDRRPGRAHRYRFPLAAYLENTAESYPQPRTRTAGVTACQPRTFRARTPDIAMSDEPRTGSDLHAHDGMSPPVRSVEEIRAIWQAARREARG
jgi:DNA-binding transcriptional ArsR family regulator